MCPSYFRIALSQDEAIIRLCEWIGKNPREAIDTDLSNAVTLACDKNGHWKGSAVYVYNNTGWTIFEDLTGSFSGMSAVNWMQFSGKESLIVAGYNDTIPYAELIVIENGEVIRDFFEESDIAENFRNIGKLPFETNDPINDWVGVASFVDEETQDGIVFSEEGTLLVFDK